jgi:hypothetical protein
MDSTRIVTDPDGNTDIWRATDLEFLDFWERTTQLGDLYKRWQDARSEDGALPQAVDGVRAIFEADQRHGRPPTSRLPDLFQATADPNAPTDFRITAPSAGLADAPLNDLFRPILRDALFSDLMLCQGLRTPLYQQIYQNVSGDERCYVRLLLPTADTNGNVGRIFGISRPLYAEQELAHWSAT